MRRVSFITSFLWLYSSICSASTISLVADEFCPFNCKEDSDKPGYMVEIAKAILEPHGHEVKYTTLPWIRALKMTAKGHHDAVIAAFKEDAPYFIFPDQEQGILVNHFFVLENNPWRFRSIKNLEGKKIGTIQGYSYGKALDQYFKKSKNIYISKSDEPLKQNLKMLIRKRLDAIIEDSSVLTYHAKKYGYPKSKFENAGAVSIGDKAFIAFSPAKTTSKHYAKLISQGMLLLRKTGTLKSILDKYGLKDWQDK